MNSYHSHQASKSDSSNQQQSAVEVLTEGGLGRPGQNLSGTDGAPPTNRAPDKCNDTFFQALRWGVDSLYLSYPGQLKEEVFEELQELKTLAQGRDDQAAKARRKMGEHSFEVKDKGSGLFPFSLEDDAFLIRLASHKAKALPMAYVKISSHYLSHVKPLQAASHLRSLLEPLCVPQTDKNPLGGLKSPSVSRIDIYVDFASNVDMEGLGRHAWVTKANSIYQYVQDQIFTGWLIGAGGILLARLYNKQIEIRKSGKTYLEPLWKEAGWDGVTPVWRLEFQFKREVLDQLRIASKADLNKGQSDMSVLHRIMENLNGLWSYATTEWLKLTIPSETDKTRSRWDIHPLWGYVSSIDWEADGGPLLRKYSPTRTPSNNFIGQRALSAMASIAAIKGVSDFEAALNLLGNAAFQVLSDRAVKVGIPESQHFQEKVALLNRKYNTASRTTETEGGSVDVSMNEYYKASKGY